jgi:hypothetical protein
MWGTPFGSWLAQSNLRGIALVDDAELLGQRPRTNGAEEAEIPQALG